MAGIKDRHDKLDLMYLGFVLMASIFEAFSQSISVNRP